ncbi:10480_t:CDS:2 [Cetraspora pellucida]|uniref:10480_t:CDS:1 n=1 Tax=Cetraspora pellucida TaxID=1433469 RepID=A0A9N9N5L3_9GLOM|nr:10480_t:CDS:2 [Cetraspora pellucida]
MNLSMCCATNKRPFEDKKNISKDVQIEKYYDIQFNNNNEDNIQVENDEDDDINDVFNEN